MIYAEAIQFLYGLRWFGAKFGLENTSKLAALAGNPQNQLRFIHVAGTNGKGSTCAMLESIYRAVGLRIGLFTSPHLVSFRERIQVNRELISEAEVVRLVGEMQPWFREFPSDHHPTFFEAATVMALKYFAGQKCDLVIWETGLGGRLDATNIVRPITSVITNVQYDHQQWLGQTLEEIAAEKAGIIKPGVPLITATDAPEALEVIRHAAHAQKAPLVEIESASRLVLPSLQQIETSVTPVLPLLGRHQQLNAALALATVEALQGKIPTSAEAIRRGLGTVQWPGRLQLVTRPGGKKILLDAAHNPAGVATLRAALEEHFPDTKPALILGIMQDKDVNLMCGILSPSTGRILCVAISSERSADPEKLRTACRRANSEVEVTTCSSVTQALEQTAGEPFVVIAGSLYLIGEAMECLNLVANPTADEKALNEWVTRP